jgi:hypothetical protein
MKNKNDSLSTPYLEWLVESRSQNQHTSLGLFKLLESLEKNHPLATFGITSVAISFSLWRAVFLAEGSGGVEQRFEDAVAFLRIVIRDNAIAYTQDKVSSEWTFRYYVNNTGLRLRGLSEMRPDILPNFRQHPGDVTPTELWEHHQKNLDLAVGNFANALKTA